MSFALLQQVEFPADAPDDDSLPSKGSSLAYRNSAEHIVFSITTPCKPREVRRSQIQMAQNNKLRLPPRDTTKTKKVVTHIHKRRNASSARTYRVATRRHKWRKTSCVNRHDLPQAPRWSPLANTNGAKHLVFTGTIFRKHRDGRRSQTQMAQNILCLPPRDTSNKSPGFGGAFVRVCEKALVTQGCSTALYLLSAFTCSYFEFLRF